MLTSSKTFIAHGEAVFFQKTGLYVLRNSFGMHHLSSLILILVILTYFDGLTFSVTFIYIYFISQITEPIGQRYQSN